MMNEMESPEDGAAITNNDQYNDYQLQSSIFETPPSILASPQFSSNLFNSPRLRSTRSVCQCCRRESPSVHTGIISNCAHRFCDGCLPLVAEKGCALCMEEQRAMNTQLSQLRLSPTHISEGLGDSRKTIAGLDSFSIWTSHATVWDSSKSLPFESNNSFENTVSSDPSGLFTPSPPHKRPPPLHLSPLPSCAQCGDDAKASHFCADCKDLLCGPCVDAHQRVKVTREHKVVALTARNKMAASLVIGQSQDMTSHSSQDDNTCSSSSCTTLPPLPTTTVCPLHEGKVLAACEWCKHLPLCSSCLLDHSTHKIVPLNDIRGSITSLVSDSRLEDRKVDEVIEGIGRMGERVAASVQAVESELRSVIHIHISALEERKRELLSLVEMIRVAKMNTLKEQNESLTQTKQRLAQMGQTAECIKDEEDQTKLQQVFDQLIQLFAVPRVSRQAHENDSIKFMCPDPSLLVKLRTLGGLESGACARNCHIVGEGFRRAIRERQASVTVNLMDACNQVCRTKTQQVAATVIGPNGTPLDVSISERESGICVLTYMPLLDGAHTLNITVRGTPIRSCPATVEVRRGRNYEEIAQQGEMFSFGREGSGDGELCRPWGICCDLSGRILVADRSNNRIQIFDKDGHFITKFGTPGTRAGQFDRPAGLTTNTLNQIIVADKDNHRIQVFDSDGNFSLKFGERGRPVGMFNYPWGVATNSLNHIAVSDTRNHRVQIFTSMGQFIRKCGFDSAYFYKHLDSPRGLCYLPDGQLLITDFNNHRLAILSASRSSPDMKCFGSEGDTEGLFCRPQGVKTDPEGHILVCDSRNNRVQIFCGDDMRWVAAFGGVSKTNGFQMPQELPTPLTLGGNTNQPPPLFAPAPTKPLLDRPTDLCVSPDGRIYVVDFGNNCIRVF